MIVKIEGPRILWQEMRWELVSMFFIAGLAYYFRHYVYSFELDIPDGALGIFGLAITFFVIFRSNKIYDRWWEARIIWGQIVNDSRTWAIQVMTWINPRNARTDLDAINVNQIQKRLIYRHIAFINALRMHLRRQDDWNELEEFIDPEELKVLLEKSNIPTHINQKQALVLENFFDSGVEQGRYKLEMMKLLQSMYDNQGKCERIKNTPFPMHYTFLTDISVWAYAIVICIYIVSQFRIFLKADLDFLTIPIAAIVGAVIIGLERLAKFHEDPFDLEVHDTPMSTLCRSIEIDLREQLGETDTPETLKPDYGVLN